MNDQALMEIKGGTFGARAVCAGDEVRLTLTGAADLLARETLDGMLSGIHAEAQRLHASSVVVNLQDLEFMNSSCMKAFVTWLARVQRLEAGARYKIRFLSRREVLWQRRSLHALRCFALDLVTVES